MCWIISIVRRLLLLVHSVTFSLGDSIIIQSHAAYRKRARVSNILPRPLSVLLLLRAARCLTWLVFILFVRCWFCCFAYDGVLYSACSICFEQFVWGKWISHGIYSITMWVWAAAAVSVKVSALHSHSELWSGFVYCFCTRINIYRFLRCYCWCRRCRLRFISTPFIFSSIRQQTPTTAKRVE